MLWTQIKGNDRPHPDMSEKRQSARETMQKRLRTRSNFAFHFYYLIFKRLLHKQFHAVRVANLPDETVFKTPKLVIYTNHPSWWDAVTFHYIAYRFLGARHVYWPFDAEMIKRYGFFSKIGAFGVEQKQALGSRHFIEACRLIFAEPRNALLLTAQGRFVDCRVRPLKLDKGIAHIGDLAPDATYLPLAIEYTHWLEKRPELLMNFGKPQDGKTFEGMSRTARLQRLENVLTQTMDELAEKSIARDVSGFQTLAIGHEGIYPVYDLWRRGKAVLTRRPYYSRHGDPP